MRTLLLLTLPLILSGCNAIYEWADGIGKHMPTIGEPCNHWQCVTESGKKKSDEIKWLDEASEKKPETKSVPIEIPKEGAPKVDVKESEKPIVPPATPTSK